MMRAMILIWDSIGTWTSDDGSGGRLILQPTPTTSNLHRRVTLNTCTCSDSFRSFQVFRRRLRVHTQRISALYAQVNLRRTVFVFLSEE